jgi:hypothetical protein
MATAAEATEFNIPPTQPRPPWLLAATFLRLGLLLAYHLGSPLRLPLRYPLRHSNDPMPCQTD